MLNPPIRAAVVTVSDSASRGEAPDTSGPAVANRLSEVPCDVVDTRLVPDEADSIEFALRSLCSAEVDLIITVGGTGCTERDITPDVTSWVITREVPGLAEAMRQASAAQHPHAWLSRAIAGIAGRTLIVNVPGSERGAVENLDAIASMLPHAVGLIRGTETHPDADAQRNG